MKPEITNAILDKVCDIAMGFIKVGLDSTGDFIDIVRFSGEDLGMQTGSMISKQMFDERVKPWFERYCRFAKDLALKKNPNVKLMLHSCGSVGAFIPTWIDMGLDILDPIQQRARGMEPERLKCDYGNQLVGLSRWYRHPTHIALRHSRRDHGRGAALHQDSGTRWGLHRCACSQCSE